MARIRTIKPEFFTSDDIVSLTPLARLFYVSLWCEADREGRLAWKPRTLKLRYLPGDDCSIEALAGELIDGGLIVIYEVAGKEYAEIPGFARHQVINNRESNSVIPPRVKHASGTRQARVQAEGKGREGKGKEEAPLTPHGGESADGECETHDEAESHEGDAATTASPTRTAKIGLAAFLAACDEAGEAAIPADDAVFAYAERIGLPEKFVALAWVWFKARYAAKRQAGVRGWRQTFRNAVEGNWPKFWFQAADGTWQLTTAGKQAQAARDADER